MFPAKSISKCSKVVPCFSDSKIQPRSESHRFRGSGTQGFKGSGVQAFRRSVVQGLQVLAPRGSGVKWFIGYFQKISLMSPFHLLNFSPIPKLLQSLGPCPQTSAASRSLSPKVSISGTGDLTISILTNKSLAHHQIYFIDLLFPNQTPGFLIFVHSFPTHITPLPHALHIYVYHQNLLKFCQKHHIIASNRSINFTERMQNISII